MIRKAGNADASELAKLFEELHRYHCDIAPEKHRMPEDDCFSEVIGKALADSEQTILVSDDNGINGYALIKTVDVDTPVKVPRRVCYIDCISVAENFRQKGIGTALFNAVEKFAKENGCNAVQLSVDAKNENAASFYGKLGLSQRTIIMEKQIQEDNMELYDELKARGLIAQVTDEAEISKMINAGKATFYIGFDPTADSLHVGHFMALCLMKRLQMAGNKPIALLGGGTGMIGDPSGKSDMRKMLTKEDIDHNIDCFKKQMSRFIDFSDDKAIMVNNADWLMSLNYIDVLREVGACFSVNKMLSFECYKQRWERGLTFLEFNYMIMQSYDFYMLYQKYGCNMQFGGDDQWANMLGGTELIRKKLGKDAHAMTITLLLNSEGKKMGKTERGAVWLDAEKTSPYDFFQYWRNVADADVIKCLKMLTFLPLEEIIEMEKWEGSQLNKAKEILAYELTKLVHGEKEAKKALEGAKSLFGGAGSTENMPTASIEAPEGTIGILDLLVATKLAPSKREARNLVSGKGISVDEKTIEDPNAVVDLSKEIILRKGKKVFLKVTKA